jgi:tRNA-dihydrouridine synthase C
VKIALAPMEGVVDARMRQMITAVGGIDWCVTEFVRVTDRLMPPKVFLALAPELAHGCLTGNGTPVRVQLLGGDPQCMAENAARAAELGAPVIDLNFGCPAKIVNRNRGGAILLDEPELLHRIVAAVRRAVPAHVPVTAKMRLGYANTDRALDCARALASGGAAEMVVHARTRADGYNPPAHWHWIARIAEVVPVPVYANGEVWSVADWRRCRAESGVANLMLGRGLIARPDLARQIRAAAQGQATTPLGWNDLVTMLSDYWQAIRAEVPERHAPGRLKQWVFALSRHYPEAQAFFLEIRRGRDCTQLDASVAGQLADRHSSTAPCAIAA